jgi:hypothetical protein
VLGPNSSLRVYRSRDEGRTFHRLAIIPAPLDRDIRDPSFFAVGRRLHIKAITRLPGFALHDKGAGTISVDISSKDARSWTRPRPIGPIGWGVFPSAGDTSYAGVVRLRGPRFLVSWYSSPLAEDPSWIIGFAFRTDIWKATVDLSRLPQPAGR